jgi:hypothetical protein
MLDDDLVLPPRLIDADPAVTEDVKAVFEFKTELGIGTAEHDRPDLGIFVLETKIKMTRTGRPKIRDLSLQPDVREMPLQENPDLLGNLRDGIDFH